MWTKECSPNGSGSMASSTKKPVDNRVHPKAHEVSACVKKMRITADRHKSNKDTTTKETKVPTMGVMCTKSSFPTNGPSDEKKYPNTPSLAISESTMYHPYPIANITKKLTKPMTAPPTAEPANKGRLSSSGILDAFMPSHAMN